MTDGLEAGVALETARLRAPVAELDGDEGLRHCAPRGHQLGVELAAVARERSGLVRRGDACGGRPGRALLTAAGHQECGDADERACLHDASVSTPKDSFDGRSLRVFEARSPEGTARPRW